MEEEMEMSEEEARELEKEAEQMLAGTTMLLPSFSHIRALVRRIKILEEGENNGRNKE